MKDIKTKMLRFEMVGSFLSVFFGSALHFVYEWTGYSKVSALIAAVNESTWEHLKLGFWPLLFWAVFEYFSFGKKLKNFVFAKFITLFGFCVLVPFFFYTYVAILGDNFLPLDILTFVISVIIAQFLGFWIMKNKKVFKMEKISLFLIVIMIVMFLSFSFFPPRIFLFLDPVSGGYGIVK